MTKSRVKPTGPAREPSNAPIDRDGFERQPGERPRPRLDAKEDADLRVKKHQQTLALSQPTRLMLGLVRIAGYLYWAARTVARLAIGRRPWRIRRILVARNAWLGDLVVFMPALTALRARFPGAHITLGVQRGFNSHGILDSTGLVDEVREISFPEGGWRRLTGAVRLFASGYDLAVHGMHYFMLRAAFFSGASRAVGIDDGHPLQAELDTAVTPLALRHEADNNLAVAEAMGASPPPGERVPRLARMLDPARLNGLLARLSVSADVPLIAMHPGSKLWSRRWPVERFAELATRLLEERPALRVVLTGTYSEAELAASIRALVPEPARQRVVDAMGACDLGELRLLLGACEAMVCNDTGVMHVARALGTPLVALLGPENDLRWGPHPLGPGPAIALRHQVPCAPCSRHLCDPHWCIRLLDVSEVQAATRDVAKAAANDGAGDGLVPLERRQRQHTWTDIADAGFETPLVSVVLVAPASDETVREDASAEEAVALAASRPTGEHDGWLAEAWVALSAQRYPRLECLVVTPNHAESALPDTKAMARRALERIVTLRHRDDPGAMWRAVLDESRGEFVCLIEAAGLAQWHPGRLAADVAALVRTPAAGLTNWPFPDGSLAASPSRLPGCTVRRATLATALAAAERASVGPRAGRPARGGNGLHPSDTGPDGRTLETAVRGLLAFAPATVSDGFVAMPPAGTHSRSASTLPARRDDALAVSNSGSDAGARGTHPVR